MQFVADANAASLFSRTPHSNDLKESSLLTNRAREETISEIFAPVANNPLPSHAISLPQQITSHDESWRRTGSHGSGSEGSFKFSFSPFRDESLLNNFSTPRQQATLSARTSLPHTASYPSTGQLHTSIETSESPLVTPASVGNQHHQHHHHHVRIESTEGSGMLSDTVSDGDTNFALITEEDPPFATDLSKADHEAQLGNLLQALGEAPKMLRSFSGSISSGMSKSFAEYRDDIDRHKRLREEMQNQRFTGTTQTPPSLLSRATPR